MWCVTKVSLVVLLVWGFSAKADDSIFSAILNPPETVDDEPAQAIEKPDPIYSKGIFAFGNSELLNTYSGFPSAENYTGDLYRPDTGAELERLPYLLVPTFDSPSAGTSNREEMEYGFSASPGFEHPLRAGTQP